MRIKLLEQALAKMISGLLMIGLVLFLPAGTLSYPQAWAFLALLFIPMFFGGIALFILRPAQLEKRLNAREKEKDQVWVVLISGLIFLAAFVLSGLNFRFRWLALPAFVSAAASAVFLLGFALYGEVIRENIYLSRLVEVQEGQKVVDTGLYGIVRHPMYLSTLLMFLSMPLILGSIQAFAVMLLYIPVIVRRIRGEERVLETGLAGYKEYLEKVKYRVLPFIW